MKFSHRIASSLFAVSLMCGIALAGTAPAQATTPAPLGSANSRAMLVVSPAVRSMYAYVDSAANGGSLTVNPVYYDRNNCVSMAATVTITVIDPTGRVITRTTNTNSSSCAKTDLTNAVFQNMTSTLDGIWTIQWSATPSTANSNLALDINPMSGGTVMPGRVWADMYSYNQRGSVGIDSATGQGAADLTFYTLGPDGVQHTVEMPSFQGFTSDITMDNIGAVLKTSPCTSAYGSVNMSTGTLASPACPGFMGYRLFLEPPDPTMPQGMLPIAGGQTWAFAPYVPANAQVKITALTGYTSGLPVANGQVNIENTGSVTGRVSVWFDANGDNVFNAAEGDRQLGSTAQMTPGDVASVPWDGLDGLGIQADGPDWRVRANLVGVGEIHFVARDVEWQAKGVQIIQTAGPAVGSSDADLVWWDDSGLGSRCMSGSTATTCASGFLPTPPAMVKSDGVHSTGGTPHMWGIKKSNGQPDGSSVTWGNDRYIDDWQQLNASAAADFAPDDVVVLKVVKTDGLTTVSPGQQVDYQVTVTNAGDLATDHFTVYDQIPAGATYVSDDSGGVYDSAARRVTWSWATPTPGLPTTWFQPKGVWTATITIQMPTGVANGTRLTNFAVVDDATDDPAADCPAGRCSPDTDVVLGPDLRISKDDGQDAAKPGELLTYTIHVDNFGGAEHAAIVSDQIPANTSFVSATTRGLVDDDGTFVPATCSDDDPDGLCAPGFFDGSQVIWEDQMFAQNEGADYQVTVQVDAAAANGDQIANLASVYPDDQTPPDCTAARMPAGCASDADTVKFPIVTIAKTDGADVARPGESLTYTLTAANAGLAASGPLALSDTLPDHVTFTSASNGGTLKDGVVTWPAFTLGANTSQTRTVTVKVDMDVPRPGTVVNTAVLADTCTGDGCVPPPPPDCPADEARCASDADAVPAPHLVASKDDGVSLVQPGQTLTYQVKVVNDGDGDAVNMTVADILPDHVTFTSASNGGTLDNGRVLWTGVKLAAGDTVTYQVVVTVDADIPRPAAIDNMVSAADVTCTPGDAGCADVPPPPDCAADPGACDHDVAPAPGLSVTKTDGVDEVRPGETVDYIIAATNTGDGDAPDMRITDTLPGHVSLVGVAQAGPADIGVLNPVPGPVTPPPASPTPQPSPTATPTPTASPSGTPTPTPTPTATPSSGAPKSHCVGSGAPCLDQPPSPDVTMPLPGKWWVVGNGFTPGKTLTVYSGGPTTTVIYDVPVASDGTVAFQADADVEGAYTVLVILYNDGTQVLPGTDPNDATQQLSAFFEIHSTLSLTGPGETPAPSADDTPTPSATDTPSATPAPAPTPSADDTVWTAVPASGYSIDGQTLAFKPMKLAAGQQVFFKVTVKIGLDIPQPSTLANMAVIQDGPNPPDCDADPAACATDTDAVPSFDLRIVKDVVQADLVDGGAVTWRITAANFGTGTAKGTKVTDMAPAQVDPSSVIFGTPTLGSVEDGVWVIGDFPPGQQASVVVTGTIAKTDLAVGEPVVNTVRIDSPDDPSGPKPDAGPQAVDDHNRTVVDVPVSGWVLPNDTGEGITVTSNTDPGHGTVSVKPDGSYVYTPDKGWTGTDTFQYTITDKNGKTSTATVTIIVTGEAAAPLAVDDHYSTQVDVPVACPVTSNDDGQQITVTSNTDPAHGTVSVKPDGSCLYTPDKGWSGADTFQYTITDANGKTSTATVVIDVVDGPLCQVNDTLEADTDGCDAVTVNVPGTTLVIAKDDGVKQVNPGDEVTYTLTASNTGQVDEPNAVVVDFLPALADFVKADNGGVYDQASRTVTWPGVRIAKGASVADTVTVKISAKAPRNTVINNLATIAGTDTAIPPDDPRTDGCPAGVCAADADKIPPGPRAGTGGTIVAGQPGWWLFAGSLAMVLFAAGGAVMLSRRMGGRG